MKVQLGNSDDLVTIITLTYKKFAYLYDTIDSVLKQDYPQIEYIIADDGSGNFPEEDIRRYIDKRKRGNLKRVLLLHNDENVGTVRNYNGALVYATGKFILSISSDDSFYNETIVSEIVSRFDKSGVDVIVCSRQFMTENGKELCIVPTKNELIHIYKMKTHLDQYRAIITTRFYRFASGSAMYFRADVLKKRGGFDTNYILWEDGPFIAQYCYEKKIQYAYDIISVNYRLGGVSTSKTKNLLLEQDGQYFTTTECVQHLDSLDWITREEVMYNSRKCLCSRLQKDILRVRFLHVKMWQLCIKIKCFMEELLETGKL